MCPRCCFCVTGSFQAEGARFSFSLPSFYPRGTGNKGEATVFWSPPGERGCSLNTAILFGGVILGKMFSLIQGVTKLRRVNVYGKYFVNSVLFYPKQGTVVESRKHIQLSGELLPLANSIQAKLNSLRLDYPNYLGWLSVINFCCCLLFFFFLQMTWALRSLFGVPDTLPFLTGKSPCSAKQTTAFTESYSTCTTSNHSLLVDKEAL